VDDKKLLKHYIKDILEEENNDKPVIFNNNSSLFNRDNFDKFKTVTYTVCIKSALDTIYPNSFITTPAAAVIGGVCSKFV
jgi:aspartyl/asparaginyl-tRNA synthetase